LLNVEADVLKNSSVVGPSGVRNVNSASSIGTGRKVFQEKRTKMVGASARDGLNRSNSIFDKSGRVVAQNNLCRGASKSRKTSDRKVFVIQRGITRDNLINLKKQKENKVRVMR